MVDFKLSLVDVSLQMMKLLKPLKPVKNGKQRVLMETSKLDNQAEGFFEMHTQN